MALIWALTLLLARTRLGRALRTIAEDSDTALLLGVDINRIVPVVFVVSGLFAALAGVVFALNYRQVHPFMGEMVGLKGISAMIVGGMGNIWGAIAGGVIIGLVEVMSIGYFGADFVDIAVSRTAAADPVRASDRLVRRRIGRPGAHMSGYLEGVLVLLAVNVVSAYGGFLPLAAGQLNIGLAGFAAIGAYSSAYLSNVYGIASADRHSDRPASWQALMALVVAVPVLRTRGIYLALATFALGQIVQASFSILKSSAAPPATRSRPSSGSRPSPPSRRSSWRWCGCCSGRASGSPSPRCTTTNASPISWAST